MAAEVGDLIQLVDRQTLLGQVCLNVFYYRMVSIVDLGDDYLSDLNIMYETQVMDLALPLQSSDLLHVAREWKNLSNNLDLYTNTTVVPGESAAGGAVMPSYVSWGFMLQRSTLATRNGFKRLAGVTDGAVEGNLPIAGAIPLLNAYAATLAADLMAGIVSVAEPVIVKRPITPPVGAYIYSSVNEASFRALGTQNTRKSGRGI